MGSTLTFTTLLGDVGGNIYTKETIGTQVWMAGNLKTTHYRNGDPIPNVTDNTAWKSLATGAYCNYNNDENYVEAYGRLYNWSAVNESRNLAPIGWHIPSNTEWTTLMTYLGGQQIASKLKETGTTHWASPNTGVTNETGFTALPGGCRGRYNGLFFSIGDMGYWWSSTYNWGEIPYFFIPSNTSYVYTDYSFHMAGFSVRCIKD